MNDNQVMLVGNLTRDPELKFSEKGVAWASFGLAHNTRKRTDDGKWEDGEVSFFNLTAFRDVAENAASSLKKGTRVIVLGSLRQRSYEVTPEGGGEPQTRSAVEVIIDSIGPDLRFATALVERTEKKGGAGEPALPPDESDF